MGMASVGGCSGKVGIRYPSISSHEFGLGLVGTSCLGLGTSGPETLGSLGWDAGFEEDGRLVVEVTSITEGCICSGNVGLR